MTSTQGIIDSPRRSGSLVIKSSKIAEKSEVKVPQSCPTLCNPMDSTVLGLLQARILEWVSCPFSSGSSWPRSRTGVSCIAGGFFTKWTIREAKNCWEVTWQLFFSPFDIRGEEGAEQWEVLLSLSKGTVWMLAISRCCADDSINSRSPSYRACASLNPGNKSSPF